MASTSAQLAKDKGNASFKSGNWAEAVGHYSAAIVADRKNPTYPLNRAAAYLKLGKHRDAERDCTLVLSIDTKNVKGLFRRAQARSALGSLLEAEKDLLEAMKIEPANVSIKAELAAVQKQRLDASKQQTSSKREPITLPSVSTHPSPGVAPTVDSRTPSRRRVVRNVPITVVDSNEPESDPQSATKFLKPIHTRVLSPSTPSQSPITSTLTPKPQPRVGAGIFHADGKHTILRMPDPQPTSSSAPTPPKASVLLPEDKSISSTPSAAPVTSSGRQIPTTYVAFSRAWNALATPQERYSLLTSIHPDTLSTLFKSSLEPELLMSILHTFNAMISPTTTMIISRYMSSLPSIPRFNTVLLFLSPEEKDVARAVLNKTGMAGEIKLAWGM